MALCNFPAEIVLRILSHSSPRDVVRWRAVSKWFRDITYDSAVWKILYANSCLPRPRGPFSYQTTAHLEHALVRTEKLARSWTTGPMRDTSHVEFRPGEQVRGRIEFLCGRWIMWCESGCCLVLHDLDAATRASERRNIWIQEKRILSWDVHTMVSEEGLIVFYVVVSEEAPWSPHWKLLELRVDSQSGERYDYNEFDFPQLQFGFRVELKGGNSPFLYIPGQRVVFDTRTGTFYDFPAFDVAREESRHEMESRPDASQLGLNRVLLTNTHVIVFYGFRSPVQAYFTLVQAFVVPHGGSLPNSATGYLRLSLSHEGITDHHFDNVALLRNSIVDPVTGVIAVKIYGQNAIHGRLHDVCGDLLLSKLPSNNVSPIKMKEMVERRYELRVYSAGSPTFPCYIKDSEDGYLRGFYWERRKPIIADSYNTATSPILKFTVDATQGKSIVTVGQPLPPRWNQIRAPRTERILFDGTRGRLCFVESRCMTVGSIRRAVLYVVVVDIE